MDGENFQRGKHAIRGGRCGLGWDGCLTVIRLWFLLLMLRVQPGAVSVLISVPHFRTRAFFWHVIGKSFSCRCLGVSIS